MAQEVPCAMCRISQTRRAKWGPHGHVTSPNWMEIQRDVGVIQATNGKVDLTSLGAGKRIKP